MKVKYHFDEYSCYIEFHFSKPGYPSLLRVREMKQTLTALFERMEKEYREKSKLTMDGEFHFSVKRILAKHRGEFSQLELLFDKGVDDEGKET